MSCIRFSTDAQRDQFRIAAPVMLTPEEAARAHPVPAMTEGKVRRLRLLAVSPDAKIRESVASNRSTPVDVLWTLAVDPDAGVRGCVARSETTPAPVLRALFRDESERVRGWTILNPSCPDDVLRLAGDDASEVVRGLIEWRRNAADPHDRAATSA